MTERDVIVVRLLCLMARCAVVGLRILSKANKRHMAASIDGLSRRLGYIEQEADHLVQGGKV